MERIELLPHNLVKIYPEEFFSDEKKPKWVVDSLTKVPLVIIRRGNIIDGKVPVGVRGVKREQRFAGYIFTKDVVSESIITPYSLIYDTWDLLSKSRRELPAINALPKIVSIMKAYKWGIGGSVGFELASRQATAKNSSDLDLILYEKNHLSREEASLLLKRLNQFGVHADLQVVHGQKGFSLEEFVNNTSETILVKTANGPKLSRDPWTEIEKD
ncbi:malonate decarboxylase holo-ACP synthase [Companilactobacillus huachuanensis]|uniref:Malonate decarboxylase holo-ACP synthase n=1 Tax=Companilactobacillus huachuanensis TaxID=2559914 RepID=A0ABW1RKF3_9LACO|nr:malonate decarboxylase holo-ACP synthase [Companilactobacillus huachuanensis]